MPIETVGTSEVLLQLVSEYQGVNGHRPTPQVLWREIASFLGAGSNRQFASYQISGAADPKSPTPQFLGDLGELVRHRLLAIRDDGKLQLTPVGRCLTVARTLPPALQDLGDRVCAAAEE